MKAGDVVIFTEGPHACRFGWTAAHHNRGGRCLQKLPGHVSAWADWSEPTELLDLLTPSQRALFRPPYVTSTREGAAVRTDVADG